MKTNNPLVCLAVVAALFSATTLAQDNCVNCHKNAKLLQKMIEKKQLPTGDLDAGQRAAQLQVSVDAMASHSALDCSDCHQADGNKAKSWHPAIQADPTADGGSVCSDCHGEEMVTNFRHSLHYTVNGVTKGLVERLAQTPDAQEIFDEMHHYPEEGCNSCHATCGQCHVSQPDFAGGGLLNKHEFIKQPETEKTCETCHYENAETHREVDAHVTKHNMTCLDCHSDVQEFHGRDIKDIPEGRLYNEGPNGTKTGPYEQTQKRDVIKVKCEDCHQDKVADHTELLTGKAALINHNEKLKCTACHTQPYTNCFGCHEDDTESVGTWETLKRVAQGALGQVGEDENIKLGLSVAGDPHSKLVPLSHSAGASKDSKVVVDLKNPETKSYWVPFAAHFVSKNPLATAEARASKRMCENCHNTDNDIFLKESDVQLGVLDPVSEQQWIVPNSRLPKH
ncbi:hypothetical protein SAMN04488540_12157 [Ferrimonas sediminum]|uniref:Uncharacterized protein n=1 Tax=Ferrimonas sediminum TaxID=718193 RepID=A0A1G8ZZN6_9GAMM|nr:hypothetical protein [Ferrimonas sediminum]SDK20589.1 hypothetical protein SAMN04488540_12157 [Ferrimonas sediminum]